MMEARLLVSCFLRVYFSNKGIFNMCYAIDVEPSAWVKLADRHYSATEGEAFEICVLAVNYGSDDIIFTVWIYIEGIIL